VYDCEFDDVLGPICSAPRLLKSQGHLIRMPYNNSSSSRFSFPKVLNLSISLAAAWMIRIDVLKMEMLLISIAQL
jgi:hypothetical protein